MTDRKWVRLELDLIAPSVVNLFTTQELVMKCICHSMLFGGFVALGLLAGCSRSNTAEIPDNPTLRPPNGIQIGPTPSLDGDKAKDAVPPGEVTPPDAGSP